VLADYVIPSVFDKRVVDAVSRAVSSAAIESGVARKRMKSEEAVRTGSA
jgi:malate dehydrogenase (oxaloacetate-decarboxylating)